jgi:hypothetical protein
MRGMAPGENKFHREIAKTEFSQQGRKGRQKISRKADFAPSPPVATSAKDAKSQREDEGIKSREKAKKTQKRRPRIDEQKTKTQPLMDADLRG